jgi:hypothetical protein
VSAKENIPQDPFRFEQVRLWRVISVDETTGEVNVKMTAEGWGWLHTISDAVESDGTYGSLFMNYVEAEPPKVEGVTDHDA